MAWLSSHNFYGVSRNQNGGTADYGHVTRVLLLLPPLFKLALTGLCVCFWLFGSVNLVLWELKISETRYKMEYKNLRGKC